MDEILLRSDKNEIAILTLNSPKNLNALSDAMLEALKLNLEEIEKSKKIKSVIIKNGEAVEFGQPLFEIM